MGESFQILRGSSIRLSSRRVCSSRLTLRKYLIRMIPLSTIAFSTAAPARGTARSAPGCSSPSPARRRRGCTSCGRRWRPRRPTGSGRCSAGCTSATYPRIRGGQGDVLEHPRARPLGDPPDRAALAGRVHALEHDADPRAGGLDPLLHGHQLALEAPHLPSRTPSASSSRNDRPRPRRDPSCPSPSSSCSTCPSVTPPLLR